MEQIATVIYKRNIGNNKMMRVKIICTVLFAIILCNVNLSAQPFTLDKKIKPLKLELAEHSEYEGAKYNEADYTLNQGAINYHYVKGHGIYQYVDIFIFSDEGNPNIQADLVYNNWSNIEDTKLTSTSDNGIINFKLRSYQDIGFIITSPESNKIDYSIIVNASKPVMNYLGSPFVKATESNIGTQVAKTPPTSTTIANPNTSGNISWWIYLIIGALLLLVGLLAGKLMGRKETLSLVLLLILIGLTTESYSQTTDLDRTRATNELTNTRRGQIDAGITRLNQAFSTADVAEELVEQYFSLGSCLRSASPPGQPRIPSFCPGEESACADCFASARAEFNRTRYNLERLQTIYDCSRSYIDAAVAFGDNVSGYHGVVGLVWQGEKRKIVRSVEDLVQAYDDKRAQNLHSFHEALVELNDCEQEHGMADWYDRFGVMFYNFVEMRYHR